MFGQLDPLILGSFNIPPGIIMLHPAIVAEIGGNSLIPVLPDIRIHIGVAPDPTVGIGVVVAVVIVRPHHHLVRGTGVVRNAILPYRILFQIHRLTEQGHIAVVCIVDDVSLLRRIIDLLWLFVFNNVAQYSESNKSSYDPKPDVFFLFRRFGSSVCIYCVGIRSALTAAGILVKLGLQFHRPVAVRALEAVGDIIGIQGEYGILIAVRAVADDIFILAVFLKSDILIALTVLIVIAFFIRPAGGCIRPGEGVIDIVVPAAVYPSVAAASQRPEACGLVHPRALRRRCRAGLL